MFLQILSLAVLLTGCFADATDEVEIIKTNCEQLNNKTISKNTEFVRCVLENNEHATFCEDCVMEYGHALSAYKDLIDINETDTKDKQPCRFRFIDANQLNLVETVVGYSKRLWELGDCSDCFDKNCDLQHYSPGTCPRSNHTLEFENLLDIALDCFNKTGDIPSNKTTAGNNTCSNCTDQYNSLSNYYNTIRLKTSDKFCFSIKYKMNTTQQHWANQLHCCEERVASSLEDFSLASSLSITLSIAFYIVTFIMGKRKERIQEIPDDLMPPRDANESGETVMNISPTDEPTTSESAAANTKIQNNLMESPSSDDDDDDEDILPVQNTNLIEIGQ